MASPRNNLDPDEQLDLFTSQRPTHDTVDAIRPNGRETLARALPRDGARTGAEGIAAPDAPGSGAEDQGRDGEPANRADEAGQDSPTGARPGLGDGSREIHPAPARVLADGHHAVGHKRPPRDEPPRNLNSYRITDADRLGEGGPKQKFQQNLKAIRKLRALESEARAATEEHKAALVKYVGWGAMLQVFDAFNPEWLKEREALRKELTEEEYEFARSTTLNAHYTSPAVIAAMYRAVERFGFRGGRILETACGLGHFIALMPGTILRCSTSTCNM